FDHVEVAIIALPTREEHPPRPRVAAVLRVAEIVDVAAESEDRAVQPVEPVAALFIRQKRRREEVDDTRCEGDWPRAAAVAVPGDEAFAVDQRLEVMERDRLQVDPGHVGRERPRAVLRRDVLWPDPPFRETGKVPGEHAILDVPMDNTCREAVT